MKFMIRLFGKDLPLFLLKCNSQKPLGGPELLKKILKKMFLILFISGLGAVAGYYSAPVLQSYFGDARISVLMEKIFSISI